MILMKKFIFNSIIIILFSDADIMKRISKLSTGKLYTDMIMSFLKFLRLTDTCRLLSD